MPQVEKEVSAIQFPYYDGETLINCKYRDGNKNFRMEKNAERVLYGLNDIDEGLTIFVEGEIDKLSCDEAGFKNTVSVPDGAPSPNTKNYSSKFSFLESAEEKLSKVKRFVIAVDNDAPGIRLRDELARRLRVERCYIVDWPEGCKDANEVLVKHGAEYLAKCLTNAKPVPIEGIFTVSDIRSKIHEIYQHGVPLGVSTGWCSLDGYFTVRPGEMTIVTGIPGSGKSEWFDALAVNLALNQDWAFGICSMENYPIERHFTKFAEKYTSAPFNEGPSPRMTEGELNQCLEWSENYFFFIMPNEAELTVEGILQTSKVLVVRHGAASAGRRAQGRWVDERAALQRQRLLRVPAPIRAPGVGPRQGRAHGESRQLGPAAPKANGVGTATRDTGHGDHESGPTGPGAVLLPAGDGCPPEFCPRAAGQRSGPRWR